MMYRSNHLPIYTFLFGSLVLSFSTNIYLYQQTLYLKKYISDINHWVSPNELQQIEKEIKRLQPNE